MLTYVWGAGGGEVVQSGGGRSKTLGREEIRSYTSQRQKIATY